MVSFVVLICFQQYFSNTMVMGLWWEEILQ